VLVELGEVPPSELLPLLRVVREPLPERGARGDVPEPAVDVQAVAAYTSRPEPLDEVDPAGPWLVVIDA
jgi:hypothetical protein